MQAIANNDGSALMAPDRLISSTSGGFRGVALDHIERLSPNANGLVIDLSQTALTHGLRGVLASTSVCM